jgi:hypothetical protein
VSRRGFGANVECPYCGAAWFQQPEDLIRLRTDVAAVLLDLERDPQGAKVVDFAFVRQIAARLRAAVSGSVPKTFETTPVPLTPANDEVTP